MTSPNNAAVSLLPAVRSDVKRIAEITANSLDATPASQFLFKPSVYRTGRRDAAMTAYFIWRTEAAFDDLTAEVIKAVDPKSGEIVGFATWQFTEKVDTFSTEPTNDGAKIPDRNRGGVDIGEPAAIVEDVNMDLMRDYFTSTGHNQVQIANVTRGESTACKFRALCLSIPPFGLLNPQLAPRFAYTSPPCLRHQICGIST
jgi:hypothetical protein